MVSSPDRNSAAIALSRFGLGARPGDVEVIAADPKGAISAEIAQRTLSMPASPDLLPTPSLLQQLFSLYDARNKAAQAQNLQGHAASSALVEGLPASRIPIDLSKLPNPVARVFLAEAKARFAGTIHEPRIGFGERLVMFFANHFAISRAKSESVGILAGAFEREAIRPYVFGKFADMLLAVETHPAMLGYLDNQLSIGPESVAGKASKRGLNENLARETLELHTLGVDGGYTQADVTSLARIITGWTITGPQGRAGVPGSFVFNAAAHEPGNQTVLTQSFRDQGFGQGQDALLALARHPATARHLAAKLARHFLADDPAKSVIDRLTKAYLASDGDLSAVYTALIEAPESWAPQRGKMRSPVEFVTAILRVTGARLDPQAVLSPLDIMGQPFWQPAQPNGYPDTAPAWATPEGVKARLDVANAFGHRFAELSDPVAMAEAAYGPLMSNDTRQSILRAESRAQGLALAFMAPEFQRR